MKKIHLGKLLNRIKNQLHRFNAENLLLLISLVLAFLTLGVAVWSVEKAGWVRPEPMLIVTLAIATVIGVLLANFRFLKKWVILVTVILGMGVTVWQSVIIYTANQEFSAFQLWWQTISNARPSDAPIYFVMFLFFVTWIIGVSSIWYLWTHRNGWVTVVLGSIMLFTNVSNLQHDKYYYFVLFFLPAILLLVCCQLIKKGTRLINWRDKKVRWSLWVYAVVMLLVAVTVTGVAYVIPEPPLDKISLKIDTSNWSLSNDWFNVFSTISSKWPTLKSHEKESLLFKDPIDISDAVQFIITSPQSTYWTVRRYDVYQSSGWTSATQTDRNEPGTNITGYPATNAQTEQISYRVENRLKTNVILTKGEVSTVDIAVRLQTFSPDNGSLTPSGTVDIAAIVSSQLVVPYQKYNVEAQVITATPEELKQAGETYPLWITGRYLQLPAAYPTRVRDLAEQITKDALTPYDKAIAIKKYLSKFPYDLNVTPPPSNRDGVDYFLFSSQKGYCTHFASAMATMLRAVDVPARFCTGYLRGENDPTTGNYLIRGTNYHAWVEVYFPNIGWIEFESTPATREASTDAAVEENTENNYAFTEEDSLPPWMVTIPDMSNITNPGSSYSPPKFPILWLYLIVLASLVIVAVFILRFILNRWVKKLIQADTAVEMYERLLVLAGRTDTRPFVYETPTEFGLRLSNSLRWQTDNINQVVNSYLTMKYSRDKVLTKLEYQRLRKAWTTLCPSLIRSMLGLKRWFFLRILWTPD